MPGLPRDTTGRVVLVTAIAMAVDLLVPWVVEDGAHRSIASVGAPALVALPILVAALLPLLRPEWRRKPAYAVLPLVAGALCAGAGGALWAVLTYLSYRLSIIAAVTAGSPNGVIPSDGSGFGLSPDVGVYLFILGGAVLVFTGYQIFLAAVDEAKTAAIRPPASIATAYMLPPPPATIPPYLQAQPGMVAYAAPATIPLAGSASLPLAQPAMSATNGQASMPLPVAAQQPMPVNANQRPAPQPSISPIPAVSNGSEPHATGTARSNGNLHVALPGSAEWNEAPRQPAHARPSLGWQRGPRVRR